MINVKIIHHDWGDMNRQMTIQDFKTTLSQLKGNWAVFAQDTAIPNEEAEYYRVNNIDQLKDGQSIRVIPQLAGG